MRRTLQLSLSAVAVFTLLAATAGIASASSARTTVYMKVNKPAHAARHRGSGKDLYYHGGAIERSAAVFLDYWGSSWANGFSTGGYSSASAQTYIQDFFGNVGGSSWARSTTQYCSGVTTGTTQCGGAGTHPANPTNELAGTWTDNVALPSSITQSAIQSEAARAEAHFGFNANANYVVLTPSGHSQSGFISTWCAYHGSTSSGGGGISYTYLPYQPDAGGACGMNFVNRSDNSFGNGYFDGFSIVGGHEYGETITDPHPNSGWLDGGGAENGDKCAWISSGQGAASDIGLGGSNFAVQSLWSNAFNSGAGGCVLSY